MTTARARETTLVDVPAPDQSVLTTAAAYGPEDATTLVVLAHGAGAGQTHPFMTGLAGAVAAHGVRVVTFDFPYRHAGRRLPDRAPVLEACFAAVVGWARARHARGGHLVRTVVAGKSLGGRMATHLATDPALALDGAVAVGYPLHPPGRPTQDRASHLSRLQAPLLVLQGTRDAFGGPAAISDAAAAAPVDVSVVAVEGADHGFAVRGRPAPDVLADLASAIAAWMDTLRRSGPPDVRSLVG